LSVKTELRLHKLFTASDAP